MNSTRLNWPEFGRSLTVAGSPWGRSVISWVEGELFVRAVEQVGAVQTPLVLIGQSHHTHSTGPMWTYWAMYVHH